VEANDFSNALQILVVCIHEKNFKVRILLDTISFNRRIFHLFYLSSMHGTLFATCSRMAGVIHARCSVDLLS